jgi:hypothetical protein
VSACRVLLIAAVLMLVAGCNSAPQREGDVTARPFRVQDVAKSDVDMVAEVQLRLTMGHLQELMTKLYLRNPREWKKGGNPSVGRAVARVFSRGRPESFPDLQGKRSVASIQLAFADDYRGDRVLALVEGMRGMLLDSYNGKQEFYLVDELDPQKLYNAARNIEITVWRLSNRRDPSGRLVLVSNATRGPVNNLSYERLFGKMIALQDSMAQIVAEATNRRIKSIIQSVASAVFLPI